MTTMEYRVVTVSGEVHRVTVRAVDVNGVERWTVVGAPRFSRSADAWSSPTAAVMCAAQERGLLVREIAPPGEMTRDEAVAAAQTRAMEVAK